MRNQQKRRKGKKSNLPKPLSSFSFFSPLLSFLSTIYYPVQSSQFECSLLNLQIKNISNHINFLKNKVCSGIKLQIRGINFFFPTLKKFRCTDCTYRDSSAKRRGESYTSVWGSWCPVSAHLYWWIFLLKKKPFWGVERSIWTQVYNFNLIVSFVNIFIICNL